MPSKLAHEVDLTKLLINYPHAHIDRGPDVDQKLRPDATLSFENGETWHVEMDTGTQTFTQLEKRWEVYSPIAKAWDEYEMLEASGETAAQQPPFVLVVTKRKKVAGLLERAGKYRIHVARYDDLLQFPYGKVLMDADVLQAPNVELQCLPELMPEALA